jgi:hypothetical protein
MSEEAGAVATLAVANGLADADMMGMYKKVRAALADAFGDVDSGVGSGQCDFWIQHEGVEYKIVATPHKLLRPHLS